MANISRLAGISVSKFRTLNKRSDMWRGLHYQLQSMGRADASCLSKPGHLSLKYILNIQFLLLGFSFSVREMVLMGLTGSTCSPKDWWGLSSVYQVWVQVLHQNLLVRVPLPAADWWWSMWTSRAFCQDQAQAPGPRKHILRHLHEKWSFLWF